MNYEEFLQSVCDKFGQAKENFIPTDFRKIYQDWLSITKNPSLLGFFRYLNDTYITPPQREEITVEGILKIIANKLHLDLSNNSNEC